MDKAAVLGVVRHILTALGGSLVTTGYVAQSEVELAAGALATIAGVVWSIIEKRRAKA